MIRVGEPMQTYSGGEIYPLDPLQEEINIEDIAGALSKLCRFGGHCLHFLSVAEHSVHVASHVSTPNKLAALLHDASEAYLVDIPRPIKRHLEEYNIYEKKIMKQIAAKFDFEWPLSAEIKRVDNAILADEKAQNMAKSNMDWVLIEPPLGVKLQFWSPAIAARNFMDAYYQYGGK
jgi:hypothetical protein